MGARKKLQRFHANVPLLDQLTASRLNDILDAVDISTLQPGAGYRIASQSVSGTALSITSKHADQSDVDFPFRVVSGPWDAQGTMHVGVISDSHCMDATDPDTCELDNSGWGLLGDDQNDDDSGWIAVTKAELPIGAKLWLQFEFNQDGNLVSVTLEWGRPADAGWQYFPDAIEMVSGDEPWQKYFRVPIAEVTDPDQDPRGGLQLNYSQADGGGNLQIVQLCRTNLILQPAFTAPYAQEPDVDLQVAVPWNAPCSTADGSADPINTDEQSMTPWLFASPGDNHPWRLRGFTDSEGQDWIKIFYGEVNGLAPAGMTKGKFLKYSVEADGVVFISASIDEDHSITSCWVDMAASDVPVDTDYEIHFVIGQFSVGGEDIEVTQVLSENVLTETFLTFNLDTFDLYRQWPHVYTRSGDTSDNLLDILFNKLYELLLAALEAAIQAIEAAAEAAKTAAEAAATAAASAATTAAEAAEAAGNWGEFAQSEASMAQEAAQTATEAVATVTEAAAEASGSRDAADLAAVDAANAADRAEAAATRAETAANKSWVVNGTCNNDGTVTITVSQA